MDQIEKDLVAAFKKALAFANEVEFLVRRAPTKKRKKMWALRKAANSTVHNLAMALQIKRRQT